MSGHPITDEPNGSDGHDGYDAQADLWGSYWLAYAEIRKRKVAAGELKPINEAEASP